MNLNNKTPKPFKEGIMIGVSSEAKQRHFKKLGDENGVQFSLTIPRKNEYIRVQDQLNYGNKEQEETKLVLNILLKN